MFFLVMQCVKPSIPRNSRIIYPRTNQVRYTHGTTIYLACHEGHLLTGSPIMVCNYTTWLKREFSCIGMFSPMRSHQSYIVWPPPLITTNINHKPISLLKETKNTSSELLRKNRSFHYLRWLPLAVLALASIPAMDGVFLVEVITRIQRVKEM